MAKSLFPNGSHLSIEEQTVLISSLVYIDGNRSICLYASVGNRRERFIAIKSFSCK